MSTPKELIFEEEARNHLKTGIDLLADAIGITLGPKGRNVGLQSSWGAPTITNDGNSVVKEISLKDQYANMGVSLGKEVASKMKEHHGDGTTSSVLLLRALVTGGIKNIASGSSPIGLKRGMDKALDLIVTELEKSAIAIADKKQTLSIATAAASGSTEIGTFISDAIQKVGKSGVITIEEGKGTETTIEMVEGMQFDRGYVSAYFCTNTESMTVEMTDAKVLITDKKITSVQEILPVLQAVASTSSPLLIIAEDIEGEALSTLVFNKIRKVLKVAAVKAPGFGDRRKALLQDLAILTGATLVSEEMGHSLKDATATVLGSAEKIVITKDKTTIVGGKGSADAIATRIKQIDAEVKTTTSSYDQEKLEERKAKLSGGVAVIRVGAATEPEMKQRKQVFEDSLNSTRAAMEEGIVAGGGMALLRSSIAAAHALSSLQGDEKVGAEIVLKACEAPFRQIVTNTGYDPSIFLEKVLLEKPSFGFNAMTEQVEDLLISGVIDPALVIKHTLKYAVSTAGIVLLSEVLIGDAPEDELKT